MGIPAPIAPAPHLMPDQRRLPKREFLHHPTDKRDQATTQPAKEKAERFARQATEFEVKVAAQKAAWEEQRLKEERLKQHLQQKELEAENNPLQGLIARIPVNSGGLSCLAINNKRLAFLGTRSGVQVYDWKREKMVSQTDHSDRWSTIEQICVDEASRFLATANRDGKIEVYKVSSTGSVKRTKQFGDKSHRPTFIAFDRKGTRIVSADRTREVRLWDVKRERLIKTVRLGDRWTSKLLAIDVDSATSTVRLTNGKNWQLMRLSDGEITQSGDYPFSISGKGIYLPDHRSIAHVRGSKLFVMQENAATPVVEFQGNGVQWTIVKAGAAQFLTGGNQKIYQWDVSTGQLSHVWALPDARYISTIIMSPDGSKMAATGNSTSQEVYIFDFKQTKIHQHPQDALSQ